MRISDMIAAHIMEILDTANGGEARLRRNELAEALGCVPSQINYVITSRFTPEQGYIVESRRGGGGYIRIRRVQAGTGVQPLMHVVNSIGDSLSPLTARAILDNLLFQNLISVPEARVISAALSDRVYRYIEPEQRELLRAVQFKNMLAAINSR